MATVNYDEVVHSAGSVVTDWNSIDPLYKWDTHFPERLSRLSVNPEYAGSSVSGAGCGGATPQRRQKRGRNRNTSRFKTQPITFDEIKEVDEEPRNVEEQVKEGLKNQFAAFSRSMDGLVPSFPILPPCLREQQRTAELHQRQVQSNAGADRSVGALSTSHTPYPAFQSDNPAMAQLTASNGCDMVASDGKMSMAAATAMTASGSSDLKAQEEAAIFAAVGLNPTLANVQDVSRARRMKRRSRKSIEEEPELEKIADANSQSAG